MYIRYENDCYQGPLTLPWGTPFDIQHVASILLTPTNPKKG